MDVQKQDGGGQAGRDILLLWSISSTAAAISSGILEHQTLLWYAASLHLRWCSQRLLDPQDPFQRQWNILYLRSEQNCDSMRQGRQWCCSTKLLEASSELTKVNAVRAMQQPQGSALTQLCTLLFHLSTSSFCVQPFITKLYCSFYHRVWQVEKIASTRPRELWGHFWKKSWKPIRKSINREFNCFKEKLNKMKLCNR